MRLHTGEPSLLNPESDRPAGQCGWLRTAEAVVATSTATAAGSMSSIKQIRIESIEKIDALFSEVVSYMKHLLMEDLNKSIQDLPAAGKMKTKFLFPAQRQSPSEQGPSGSTLEGVD